TTSHTLSLHDALPIFRIPVINKGIAYLRWGPLFRLRGEHFDPEILNRMAIAIKEEYVEHRGLLLRMLPAVFEADPFAAAFSGARSEEHTSELQSRGHL